MVLDNGKNIFKLSVLGMSLFIVLSLYNRATWGASFSYVAIPSALLVLAGISNKVYIRLESLYLIPFFLIYFFSTATSQYVEMKSDIITFAIFIVVLIITSSINFTNKELKIIIIVYLIVSLSGSINIIYNWFRHNYIQYWLQRSSFKFLGKFKDPNYVLAFSAPASILSVFVFLNTKKNKFMRIFSGLNFLLCAFSCLCAGTRAGMLSILVSILLIIIIVKKITKRTKLKILLIISICILIGVLFILNFYNKYALERMFHDDDGSGRLEIWKSALSVFKNNPLFGGGFNSGSSVSLITNSFSTHSIFVDILCDSGVLGLLFFIMYFITNCLKCRKDNIEFQLVLGCAFLIPMFFINGFNTTTLYFPLIILSVFSSYCRKHNYLSLVRF